MTDRAGERVLGVDTALRCTGVGVVEARAGVPRVLEYGVLRNPAARPRSACLAHLQAGIARLIERHAPTAVAIEGVFYFRNARTAMVLGEARGAVIAAAAQTGLPVFEYAPRTVKQALTGWGAADKSQVAKMVAALCRLNPPPAADAADALAIALCHLQHAAARRRGAGGPRPL